MNAQRPDDIDGEIEGIGEVWRSAGNRPRPEEAERLAAGFLAGMRRARRRRAWWLAWTLTALAAVTGLAVFQVAQVGFAGLAGEWALLPILAFPWFVALRFLRAFLQGDAARDHAVLPLKDALLAARRANDQQRRHLHLIAALFAAMAPVTALAIRQLHTAGKASISEAWSMAALFGGAFLAGAIALGIRARFFLRPEKRRLEGLLTELEAPDRSSPAPG